MVVLVFLNNFSFLIRHDTWCVHCFCQISCVSGGHVIFVVVELAIVHKPIAKVFYLLKLPTLSIGNVALWRSGSRNLATSMMEVIVTIVNNWLIVIYYHKDFHHRCCSGLRSLFLIQEKKLDSTGFSHSKLKDSLPQNWIYCFFFLISHFFSIGHICFVTSLLFLTNQLFS